MNRREFLVASWTAALSSAFLASVGRLGRADAKAAPGALTPNPKTDGQAAPLPEITAVVDTLIPPDPDVPGDFKGSDYHGDYVLAANLGDTGQNVVVMMLNQYAQNAAGKDFIACTPDERLAALKAWIVDAASLDPLIQDMLTGVLTLSMIGTFERNPPEEQEKLFTSMGWYDPADPAGTFRVPNEGFVDSFQFPVHLKDGVRK
jgi:hypothetical protein